MEITGVAYVVTWFFVLFGGLCAWLALPRTGFMIFLSIALDKLQLVNFNAALDSSSSGGFHNFISTIILMAFAAVSIIWDLSSLPSRCKEVKECVDKRE